MFKFFKKNNNLEELEDDDINLYALRLLIHLALSDGEIDESEINELKRFIEESSLSGNISRFLEKEITSVEISSSFFEEVSKINSSFTDNEKLNLLEKIWSLILIDGVIDPYEENLFYRIGELIKIKRSLLNKVKLRLS
tara:strand:- start:103 stop:519 length:417 start_codon:yes stop_codon:yes gene_type:complete